MDEIFIRDLEIFARHGVLQEEKNLGQKFIISAALRFDCRRAGKRDELSESINYAKVCHYMEELLQEKSFDLIEAAAEYLCERLLLKFAPLLQEVELSLKKPWAPVGMHLDTVGVTLKRGWHTAYLSLGSNMGVRENYLLDAINLIDSNEYSYVTKKSQIIETEPYGVTDQDQFLNVAIEIKTLLEPAELLGLCGEAEQKACRVRERKWGPRTLDADIVFYDEDVINMSEPELCIPHMDMHNRLFVLQPLNEIAPGYVHPLYKKSIRVMYEELLSGENNA